jgi:hypothetical protein
LFSVLQLPKSFNGCMKQFTVNGEVQDVHAVGRAVHVTKDCHEQVDAGLYLVQILKS